MTTEIKNARIRATELGVEDHGIFTFWLHLDYDGAGQGFGGWALDTWDENFGMRVGTAWGLDMIMRVLSTLEVSSWEKLPGTFCRVKASFSEVEAIGHILKDQWFAPSDLRGAK